MNMTQPLYWKLRRIAAGIRQQDIALRSGISTTRYSAIERGECVPSELEARLIEQFLPRLPGFELRKDDPGSAPSEHECRDLEASGGGH
jgi:transcriptional regulator with XRE-family HTH domain